jgi:tRNA pseudouridine38-40 synthase
MRNLKVTIGYDGTNFQGWQEQKTGRTVEGEIRKALYFMHKHPMDINAAGRTDSGVHATGQVINYHSDLDSIPIERYCRALNSFLPLDVRARQVELAADDFHARHDARERSYKYYLYPSDVPEAHYRLYSDRIVRHPNVNLLNDMAATLIGTHDFTSFSALSEDTPNRVRTIHAACFHMEGPFLVFYIAGNGFLWRMVRSIVGSLLMYEAEGLAARDVQERLEAKNRKLAGPTAPAWGLFLHRVRYENELRVF